MHVEIEWGEPIQLTKHQKFIIDEKKLLTLVEKRPGIYFFSRKHGDVIDPFYVGETISIRGRLKAHWKSAAIQDVLRGLGNQEIKSGVRYFHFGYLAKITTEPKNT